VGRATKESDSGNPLRWNFNPRPPWGGRLHSRFLLFHRIVFQSTPSVGRATANYLFDHWTPEQFQSTPSVGRATRKGSDAM